MESILERRILGVCFLVVLFSLSLQPCLTADSISSSTPEAVQTGPFVDSIWLKEMDGDEAALRLMNGSVDVVDDVIDPVWMPQLSEAEGVSLTSLPRNGYGYLVINTAKYPFNITDFRRAAAFALDKWGICNEAWEGMARPLDSPVPPVGPFSIEGQLSYDYYDADVALGNQLLDNAGFNDADDDGYREAPDGSDFDVIIEVTEASDVAIAVGEYMEVALDSLHINSTSVPTDFSKYFSRIYCHYDFDIAFFGSSFSNTDVDWLAYEFWSEYADEPYWNLARWRNATYDSWRDQLLHSTDYDEVYEAAIEMQRILVHACPVIVCYENYYCFAHRTDRFEHFVPDNDQGIGGYWSALKVRLKASEGGPLGGTIKWGVGGCTKYNFMVSCSCYPHELNTLPWDTLVRRGPDGSYIPWLAETYKIETHNDNSSVAEGKTRITFSLVRNASWSDGVPLTAQDVAFTFSYYRDSVGNPYGAGLLCMTAAYARTTHEAVIEFEGESFWHLSTVLSEPILPRHVFSEMGPDGWSTWDPNPFEEPMVTSGPFYWNATLSNGFHEMKANPGYFHRPDPADYLPSATTSNSTLPEWPLSPLSLAVTAGALTVISGVVML